MMNRFVLFFLILGAAYNLSAQKADIVYVDGWVDVKVHGELREAFEGDVLKKGDSVITGNDSYAELSQKDLSSIIVKPDSIFTIQEREGENGKETVLTTTVGSVSFKFGKLFGKEPVIATPGMVAGVRGTEFTVYAGQDGSALVAVKSGLVTVSSNGKAVDLGADEGVEVKPGQPPGDKFKLKGRELDFSTWNKEKYSALLADPLKGLDQMESRIDSFVEDIEEYSKILTSMKRERDNLRAEWQKLMDAGRKDEAKKFYREKISPIELKLGPAFINRRYYSLSALSFRRYILGKLYVDMKGIYFADRDNPVYREFLDRYASVMDKFEKSVVPFLDVNDI